MLKGGVPLDPQVPYIVFTWGAVGCTACQKEIVLEGSLVERAQEILGFVKEHNHEPDQESLESDD